MTSDKIQARLLIVLSVVAVLAVGLGVYTLTQLGPLADRTASTAMDTKATQHNFELLSRHYAATNNANLAQIRRTSTANHRQALAIARISIQRADDAARAARQLRALAEANHMAVVALTVAERRIGDQARQIARLVVEQGQVVRQRNHAICVQVELVKTTIRTSITQADATLGKPGTAAYAYYQAFPKELAAAHAQDRALIRQFRRLRCA